MAKKKTSLDGGLIGTLRLLNIAYKSMDLTPSLQQQQIQRILPYSIFSMLIKTGLMALICKPLFFLHSLRSASNPNS